MTLRALLTCLAMLPAMSAFGDVKPGTADEAKAMVSAVIAHLQKFGREKTFSEINDPKGPFIDRDLYAVIYDLEGNVLAHGANSGMRGKNVIEMRDVDGKYFVRERVEMMSKSPDASGWQDYKFWNPVTRKIEPKSMYLRRFESLIVGCGIYKKSK